MNFKEEAVRRTDGRAADALRPMILERGFTRWAEGSVRVAMGHTIVLCTASVEETVPQFLQHAGSGWVTAEYSMLPRATHTRTSRQRASGSGRSQEISRLVGRSLRAAIDLQALGARTITIDCDVLQADGGTRTAAVNGGLVALADACRWLVARSLLTESPLRDEVAAISVGILGGVPILDLDYEEDSQADVDMNVVMLGRGDLVEVQGTAEHSPFSRDALSRMLDLAASGIAQVREVQRAAMLAEASA